MAFEKPKFPYPGLRPFDEDQQIIFFGREAQTSQVLKLLGQHRFVAVVGESGCGKSSLVRAGVLPNVRGGMIDGSGAAWRIAVMRPGTAPIRALARECAKD